MIFFILFLGILLRLISLNQSLWLDEATSALVAKMSFADMFTKFLPGDFHPPLYYIFLKWWVYFFGATEMSIRIPSLVFGVATIWITYLIGKKILNEKLAYTAALLTATSGLLIYYSQEARMYSMAALMTSLTFLFFLNRKWVIFSITIALLGMTDYVALLILPVFWILGHKNIKKIILSHIPLLILFLFWGKIFITQLSGGIAIQGSAWWGILGTASFKNILLIPVKFILGRISFDSDQIYFAVVFSVFLIFEYLLYKSKGAPKILWFWLVTPIALGIILSFKIPTLSYFRFIFCLPAFYLLVANGIGNSGKFFRNILIFIFLINICSSFYYLGSPRFWREDWRGLVTFIEGQKSEKSVTVFIADSNMEAYRYYAPNAKITGPAGIDSKFEDIWLMRYLVEIFDPTDKTKRRIEKIGYIKSGEYNFNGIPVWHYSK